jgi:hypothetical protein
VKRILIEWHRYDGEKHASPSSAEVLRIISHAIETMRPFLRTMQTQLDFRETRLTADETGLSGTITVNGKEIGRRAEETLSEETLIDALLKETARFAKGCAGSPDDLSR